MDFLISVGYLILFISCVLVFAALTISGDVSQEERDNGKD